MLKLNVQNSVFHEQIYLIRNQAKEAVTIRVPKNVVASPCIVAKNPVTKKGELNKN
jgi:hypothetical protein